MQDYHELDIWQRGMDYTVQTCLELGKRLYSSLPAASIDTLIEEGNQISRMTYALIQRIGAGAQ